MGVVINIKMIPSNKNGRFHDVVLTLTDSKNVSSSINTIFDFEPFWLRTKDNSSIAYDFLFLSVMVYDIDRIVSRDKYSNEGWCRDIRVDNIPIVNIDIFNKCKQDLVHAINFLTGDSWSFNFVQSDIIDYNKRKRSSFIDKEQLSTFDKVCLFSGGLDSLIGFIDLMENNDSVLLISHKGLGKERKDQDGIIDEVKKLGLYAEQFEMLQSNVGIGRKLSGVSKIKYETTFRSRSLLFIAMGIYMSYNISDETSLIVPENGTISLNMPLEPSRRSACSTRTTHPYFIHSIQAALKKLGFNNQIETPYSFATKGEMYRDCKNQTLLDQLVNLSCSCAKRGHNQYWDATSNDIKTKGIRHCGMCLPCLYRRVSLFLCGKDNNISDIYGTDVFNGKKYDIKKKGQKSSSDFRALLYFIKQNRTKYEIESELVVCGIRDIHNLHNYSDLILRTIEQIKDLIANKGSNEIKKMAGIK